MAVNQFINDDNFPFLLKKAVVKQIFKSVDNVWVSNCRLISLILVIPKIFERVVAEQLVELLDHINVLHP